MIEMNIFTDDVELMAKLAMVLHPRNATFVTTSGAGAKVAGGMTLFNADTTAGDIPVSSLMHEPLSPLMHEPVAVAKPKLSAKQKAHAKTQAAPVADVPERIYTERDVVEAVTELANKKKVGAAAAVIHSIKISENPDRFAVRTSDIPKELYGELMTKIAEAMAV